MGPINSNIKTHDIPVPMNIMLEFIPLHRGLKKDITLAEQVYEHILKEIVFPGEGHSPAIEYGGKITESIVAKALGISNGPVREAVFRLRQEGWVRTVGNKGSFLIDFSDPEIAREIYQFRLSFETGTFYSLATRITDAQIDTMRDILNALEKAKARGDMTTFRKMDVNFHLQVAEFAGGSSYAQLLRSKLLQWYAMAYHVLMRSMGEERYRRNLEGAGASSHKDLFDALAARDSDRAARLITHHLSHISHLLGIDS
ncbi:MAG: GntR family transcriptional regulator [Anaerohalosphaeraceae bacterium]